MIICVSANPAIDRRLRLKSLRIGAVNRAVSVEAFAGGKAAHVAMAVRALGEDVIWIGFSGGATGNEIERQLNDLKIRVVAVHTNVPTRTNDEIIDESGQTTEILEPGGNVSDEEIEKMYGVCRKLFAGAASGFQAVFSGSLPPNVPMGFYSDLILSAHENGGKVILDTSGEPFLQGLEAAPDLIKPNCEEAEKAADLKIDNELTAISAARRLRECGARNVALSLGARGIVWLNGKNNSAILAVPPRVEVVSTVGCGDATVAGFAVAAQRRWSEEEGLRLAAACGAANCLAERPGQINILDVECLLPSVSLKTFEMDRQTEFARK
jgi:1-phosphofructokinase family hexose kinase